MKTLILSTLLMSMSTLLNAQGLYFRAGGGYGIPSEKQVLGIESTSSRNLTTFTSTSTVKTVYGSLGAGLQLHLSAGYMFNKNIGMDLGVAYVVGKTITLFSVENITRTDGTLAKYTVGSDLKANTLLINPSFIMTTGTGTKKPYIKIGMILGQGKTIQNENYYDNYYTSGTQQDRSGEFKNEMGFGYSSSMGMNWVISNNMELFTEINFYSLNLYPKEYNLLTDIVNGKDMIPDYSISQKKTVFVKSIDPNRQYDPAKPSESLRYPIPYSSLSLRIGIV